MGAAPIARGALRQLSNGCLVIISIFIACAFAEAATRVVDGLPIFTDWLPDTLDRGLAARYVDVIPRATGVERAWFFSDPPPLPNRATPPPEWDDLAREIFVAPMTTKYAFRTAEAFKVWNDKFVGTPCSHPVLRLAPGSLYAYSPADGSRYPRYRFYPDATTPLGLVTNRIGWRGPPIRTRSDRKLVRIVFVGASTTVNSHYYPYSYPEFIGHWLNLWAQSRNVDIDFEALNAGREMLQSTDIEAVVRQEALPLRPDLVVYYEGANQFDLRSLVSSPAGGQPRQPDQVKPDTFVGHWLRSLSHRLALARRLQAALGLIDNPGRGEEWPKPDVKLTWPSAHDEADPDLSNTNLPLNLSTILRDLDRIRVDVESIGSELVLSSFVRLGHEGLVVDPIRNKSLLEFLNVVYFPFKYADLDRAAKFQNRVLRKFARKHDLAFIDVDAAIPRDPDLFTNSVHMTYAGVRLHAWIVMQAMVPLIEAKLATGSWPRILRKSLDVPSSLLFTPYKMKVACP